MHNLDHSNIVVTYSLTTSEKLYELRDVMGSVGVAGALGVTWFYDKLKPGTTVLIAWGGSDTMRDIDEERINTLFQHLWRHHEAGNRFLQQLRSHAIGLLRGEAWRQIKPGIEEVV